MNLHEKTHSKAIARRVAPFVSHVMVKTGLSTGMRKLIAFLNYCLGQGAGMGWGLDTEIDVAIRCIRNKEPVVLDVGGNLGHWSEKFRQKIHGGRLFIFEPQTFCQESILGKNIPNMQLVRSAVGEQRSTMTLYSSAKDDGTASLHERGDSFFARNIYKEQVVDVVCLDDFIRDNDIAFVDYIKFDIEGHELFALKGMKSSLEAGKVGAFSFEFGSGNLNSRTIFRDFWNLLHGNYTIHIITPSGKLSEITHYYEDLEYYRGVSNFVAMLRK